MSDFERRLLLHILFYQVVDG